MSDVWSPVSILRSAPSLVGGEGRELPLFVKLGNDLVISVAEGVGEFRGSNFNLAPLRVLLMHLGFNFSSRSQHQTSYK